MKYTIGKIAKSLGVSTQCVRYYESMGIIDSQRNENNQYRTYTSKDAKTLFQTCLYRSMGFSLKDIRMMLSEYNVNEVANLFEKRIEDIDRQIEELTALRHELYDYKTGLIRVSTHLNQVEIVNENFSFYLVLKNEPGSDIPTEEDDFLIECEQLAPYVRQASVVDASTVYGEDEDVHFRYGLSMSASFVKSQGKEEMMKEYLVHIDKMYAKMNIEMKESNDYAENLRRFLSEIRKAGYEPADKIYGVLRLVSLHDGEKDIYEYVVQVTKAQG